MSDPINEKWMNATVKIENELGQTGTGFLINSGTKKILVTNKHVLHKEQARRESANIINLHVNILENSIIRGKKIQFSLRENGGKIWNEHPDPDVDVLAIDVSTICSSVENLATKPMESSLICTRSMLQEFNITNGRRVVVLGYPLTIRQSENNRPLRISGAISSDIGQTVSYPWYNTITHRSEEKTIRGFVIESGATLGSSGSPVVLEPIINTSGGNQDIIGNTLPPLLLGIISQEQQVIISTIQGQELAPSRLIVVCDAETILDVINLFA